MKIDHSKLKAKPHEEDFRRKYTKEGSSKIGARLLDNYFLSVEKLLQTANLSKGAKTLEVGCGEGFSTKRLREILDKNIALEGSEFVAEQIPNAQLHNPGVRIIEESVYDLKRKDNSLDVIFLLEVMEHLDHPEAALKEVLRVLKPGGLLIVGVPREPIWRVLNMLRGKYIKDLGNTPGHLNHWSKKAKVRFINENFGEVVASESPLPWTILLAQKEA